MQKLRCQLGYHKWGVVRVVTAPTLSDWVDAAWDYLHAQNCILCSTRRVQKVYAKTSMGIRISDWCIVSMKGE